MRFELRDKGGIEAELRRVMESKVDMRGAIKVGASNGEEMAEETL